MRFADLKKAFDTIDHESKSVTFHASVTLIQGGQLPESVDRVPVMCSGGHGFNGTRSFRYKVVSIQVVSIQLEVDSLHM